MPLYEFRCADCGPFEQWRAMAEAKNPMHCPECHEVAKRIFSAPSVMLNSSFRLREKPSAEPKLVKREEREPAANKYTNHTAGRPWMLNH
ncbi:MAG: zinc ribbon domain-containing protein [Leptolyngbya sp. DLM2.Bin15]|uniref:FmdB family zinc ribbon protein n=1 Tax=Leptolyngbya sp. CCY15150 TaxID=2767772 RepID=UPI0013845520|nr:zinc ribbon domain-containing protein [Leptolyngbya sp. CCY15150]MBF2089689.1 zinc ribbon domain-containing protein [Synechococcales cyanobacterium K32_A2020_035]MBF2093273.1 zinc ribbon domain-containing protein [Synechococcales cyanobacterium K44_A2020_017]TVQ20765.1 MAG: zinc ribbon domain-containing protein [Leptolyngbya sp. DLM2.Bin15]